MKNINTKAEEKILYEEYKKKVNELKKKKKNNTTVGQVFTKGLLPIYILHTLNISPSNGNDLSAKIGDATNNLWTPSTGGIYPLLKKFEHEGLIIGEWDDPKKKFQKIYKLTPLGLKEFNNKKTLLQPKIEASLEVFKIIYNDLYEKS